ncbi:hypothetical protein EDC56_0049 [Sinobacterium caligoides]|uniref:Uncharacterized protein n=1 Tax=Sinobacterium caligoides TaxID=933926 RepID=A0A3N2E2I4_9GAMM|nr:hypothetical protein [Sinobacterium caligoides]ROS06142.1 hypothetical protein EDC56_0049 [Sinobacterium caligoides]
MLTRKHNLACFLLLMAVTTALSLSIYQSGRSFQASSSLMLEQDIPRLTTINSLNSEVGRLLTIYTNLKNTPSPIQPNLELAHSLLAASIINFQEPNTLKKLQLKLWKIEKISNNNSQIILELEAIQSNLKTIQQSLTFKLSEHGRESIQQAITLSGRIELYTVIIFIVGTALTLTHLPSREYPAKNNLQS